jgi:hypothetical protein
MRHVDAVYTQKFNRSYSLDGSLFKGRYKSFLIEDDKYLLQILWYIHRNPLEAGLESRLGTYPWCSYNGYLSDSKEWDWIYKDFLLAMFSELKPDALSQYKEYMEKESSKELKEILKRKNQSSIFGSDGFKEMIKKRFSMTKAVEEIPRSKLLLPDIFQIKKVICDYYHVDENDLHKTRRNKSNEPRKMAIYLTKQMRGEKLIDIAKEFGMKKYSSVSSVVNRLKEELRSNKKLLKRYNEIVSIINDQMSHAKT